MSNYEIVTTSTGAISIRDNFTREIMHNPVGPWLESNSLYIEQSRLAERLGRNLSEELVLLDVGLGAAANSLAVLHCARKLESRRPLQMISFERDLTLLQFALDHSDQFAHFSGFESAIRQILDRGFWQDEGIRWELRHGDFTEQISQETARADLVYFDPYSPLKNPDMWSSETFKKIWEHCKPNPGEGSLLLTYSRATPVRVNMLLAGFYVGVGISSGLKDETTQASTQLEGLSAPLDQNWLRRWEKSSKPYAAGTTPEQALVIRNFISKHIQFQ